MGFSLSKIFSKKKFNSVDSIDAIIKDVENKPFGVADTSVLFAGLNELGGYYFFQTVIVGQLNIRLRDGAKLSFKGDNFELTLNSDMAELESARSDIKGRNVTKIDFEIDESDIKKLEDTTLKSIVLHAKKQDILFSKYNVVSDEEE